LKINRVTLWFSVFLTYIFLSCEKKVENDALKNINMVGCWKGGLIHNGTITERDPQLRLLSLKPDSTLALTAIYELGPRSRVWEYDHEITYKDKNISWLAHQGTVSKNGDTMYVTKNWKGEESQWMFFRDRSSDPIMNQLMSSEDSEYAYKVPDERSDGWICTGTGDVGIDEAKITRLINRIKKGKHGDIHSILICRNGKLVLEEYFAMDGKISGSFVTDLFRKKVHHLASTTKGVLSILCGMAIDQGLISDVEEPIYKYLPGYANSFTQKSKQIKVKDMLTMTAGWEWEQFKYQWNDPRNNAAAMMNCGDAIKYVVERPLAAEPGKKFKYSNGVPTVMGVVLKNACGMEVDKFAEKSLFQPLGILDYLWTRYPDSSLETDGGLALRSRDLAKIGQLFLNDGKWEGNQIISESWIQESTRRRVSLSKNRGYGYYWNEMNFNFRGLSEKAIFIPGDGGQFIAVFPSLDMIIVFTAGNYGTNPTTTYWKLIKNEILPALTEVDMQR
jgi:CubicO group peptidase (beta-lactamase class C family)